MLGRAQLQGADLFQRLVDAAAARARSALGDRPVLRRCDDVTIGKGDDEVRLEAWCVREGGGSATISALATGRDGQGRERLVAAGRFTFAIVARDGEGVA